MDITKVVIIGILLVFIILVLLTLLLMLFPIFTKKKTKKELNNTIQTKTTTQSESTDVNNDNGALISVITAAIAQYRSQTGQSINPNNFKVVAFRKSNKQS